MERKVYVVKQTSEKDCGAASLLSIIKYHGGNMSLEKIKFDAKTDSQGTRAYDLLEASKKYGFDSRGLKIPVDQINSTSRYFPYIAHVKYKNYNHYIVVYNVSNKKIQIMDPMYGKKTIGENEFENIFTGNILEFVPRSKIINIKTSNKINELFISVINSEKQIFINLLICTFTLTILTIFCSFYLKVLLDAINKDISLIKFFILLFFITTIFKVIISCIKISYESYLNKNLDVRLFREFFEHLFYLPSKSIENKSVGEIVSRINDLNQIKVIFTELFVSVLLDSLLVLIAVLILVNISTKLTIVLLLAVLLYLLAGIIFSKLLYKKIMYNKEIETNFNKCIIENIMMFSNIKHLNKTRQTLKIVESSACSFLHDSYIIQCTNNLYNKIKILISEVTFFMINTLGVYLIYEDKLSIPDLILFNTLTNFFLDPIKNLINNIPRYNFIRAGVYKLNEFLSLEMEKTGEINILDNFDIEVKDLNFSYNEVKQVITNFNANIKHGEKIFLKGKSGGGKSTFCKLLLKKENLTSGELKINNINILDISLSTIKENIVYVSQKEYLFSATIKENITFYDDIDLNQLSKVSKICKIDEILLSKNIGYDSYIEMDANNFSGGEMQRITLARALMGKFNILIIDESLSEVDLETEKEIINNIMQSYEDKTIIYISHKEVEKCFKRVLKIE